MLNIFKRETKGVMNFGTIKDIYAKILVDSYINESKESDKYKKTYKNFIKMISENQILRTQFIVYKNIENGYLPSEVSASDYLKENISLFDKFTKKGIIKENEKLFSKVPSEYFFEQNYVGNKEKKELHEAIHNLIILEKKAETINTLHESFEYVKKWLTIPKQILEIKKPKIDADKFLNIAVEKYNEKYSNLSEEEKKVLKTIISSDRTEKETLLKDMVKESITLINNALREFSDNIEIKSRLLEAKDVVYNIEFNEETYKEDIFKIYDLKKSLS